LDARSWDHLSHPLKRDSSLRPCWTDFLSILRECPALGCFAERFFPYLLGCLTRTEDLPKE
jgi:hypothetical protein